MAATAAAIALGAGVTYVGVTAAKKELAKYLAQAMSTFFDVDPEQIEANLRSDTKLALNHVRLKPLDNVIPGGGRLEGVVDRIEFSWNWGGGSKKGSTVFVRNATLSIHGARFRIVNKPKGEAPSTTDDNQESSTNDNAAEPQQPEKDDTVNRHVQQIIDQLALNIVDLQFTIETQGSNDDGPQQNVVFEAKSLKLVSLGRDVDADAEEPPPPAPPLLQQISVDSFCAYITEGGKEQGADQLWLLKPFGCTASVKRVSGQRFSGLDSGLEVVGEGLKEPSSSSSSGENAISSDKTTMDQEGVTIYAGTVQVQALLRVMAMLLPQDSSSSSSPASTTTQGSSSSDSRNHHSSSLRVDSGGGVECVRSKDNKDQEQKVSAEEEGEDIDKAAEHDPSSSHLVLPLQSVKVILPNGSAIRMPDLCFHYRMDGTVCNVQATGGIFVNNEYPLILLQDGARCLVDFTGNTILLDRPKVAGTKHDTVNDDQNGTDAKEDPSLSAMHMVARVTWHEKEMKPLLEGFKKITELAIPPPDESEESATLETNPSDESEVCAAQETNPSDPSALSSPWSLKIDGIISARFEGGGGKNQADDEWQWIEASLKSPSYVLSDRPDEMPSQISVKGARFGPSSFGDISIHMSEVTMAANNFPYTAVNDVQDFVMRVLCLDAL